MDSSAKAGEELRIIEIQAESAVTAAKLTLGSADETKISRLFLNYFQERVSRLEKQQEQEFEESYSVGPEEISGSNRSRSRNSSRVKSQTQTKQSKNSLSTKAVSDQRKLMKPPQESGPAFDFFSSFQSAKLFPSEATRKPCCDSEEKSEKGTVQKIQTLIKKLNASLEGCKGSVEKLKNMVKQDKNAILRLDDPKEIAVCKILFASASNHFYYRPESDLKDPREEESWYFDNENFFLLASRVSSAVSFSGDKKGKGENEADLLKATNSHHNVKLTENNITFCSKGLCGTPDAIAIKKGGKIEAVGEFKYHATQPSVQTNARDVEQLEIYVIITKAKAGYLSFGSRGKPFTSEKVQGFNENKSYDWINKVAMRHQSFLNAAIKKYGLKLENWLK
jgi:hypothetical protein